MRAKVQAAPYPAARKGTDGMKTIAGSISDEIGRPQKQVENVISLLDEGNTIPFIARYRKEAHGAMDDVLLRKLEERLSFYRGLEKRKEEVLRLIQEKGKLTEELERAVRSASTRILSSGFFRSSGSSPTCHPTNRQSPCQVKVDSGRVYSVPDSTCTGSMLPTPCSP